MKSERRHDLKKNELADKVAGTVEQLQPYWRAIAGVAVVLATAVFALGFVSSTQRKSRESSWANFFAAAADRNPDALQQLADAQHGNPVAPWALQAAAQARLIEASAALYRDRAEARKGLQVAVDGFEATLEQTNEALLRQRCLFGLGQAYEGLNDLDEAKSRYQQLAETWPDSSIAKQAKQRIESLSDPKTQEFYTWFFAQEPPAAPTSPLGTTPSLPFGQLPSEPDISIPDPSASVGEGDDASETSGSETSGLLLDGPIDPPSGSDLELPSLELNADQVEEDATDSDDSAAGETSADAEEGADEAAN